MFITEFQRLSRREVLKEYRRLRYVKNNRSYFLYFIFESGECVYVGETSNIFWRMVKHKGKCSEQSVICLKEYHDKQEVLKLEKHYIRTLKPKFNNRYCLEGQLELFAA
ncbi:GIY-YIG nuclease family protein [Pontibacter harenae]|uniref:GIY-YIG nuclease family protein n=1 Tax=Pontibacter harenae TaxID=2894083 RepID=UPI0034E231C4|nr:GIY-YIG nuclease family protein [Pontibacter harenae]